jgi:hypothetical protein
LTRESEQLGNFRDSSDIFCPVLSSEPKVLVEASADNVSVEDKAFA